MVLPKVVKIAVEQTAFHFDKLYSYVVPENLQPVDRGCRVLVPFGGGNRRRQGIIVDTDAAPDVSKLKPVYAVLEHEPLLDGEMMDLALWIKERTFCTLFDVVRAMLPTGLYMHIKPVYKAVADFQDTLGALSADEHAAIRLAASATDGIDRDRLLNKLGMTPDNDLPERLVRMGALVRSDDAFRRIGDASIRMVRLAVEEDALCDLVNAARCTDKQKSVIRLLQDVDCASVKELCYFCSVTVAVVTSLERKGIVQTYDSEVLRSPFEHIEAAPQVVSTALSPEQQKAFDDLLTRYRSGKASASLLYGVTGSGKTQVYMNLIDQVIADGRQVLVLVPEISLTPQMLSIFLKRYGRRVAVLHSGLAIGERMDEWKRIRRGEAQIAVGTRSAVFAPFDHLGLIVMDEEQEHTYKSESAPRYHARDVARYRCVRHNAMLLLASATPSIESFYAAKSGRYALQSLPSRFGEAQLPEVEVVDMRQQEGEANGILSPRLKQVMQETLEQGKQVILLLNRRGYNTFVSCRSCGHVITCPSCSISLTYHSANGRLMCHYCGHSENVVAVCPECGSNKIRYSGLGTQKVEQELAQAFPKASVLRMDADSTMSRFSYEKKFDQFAKGQFQIMIGTQMVAKGLDFPDVGLVGVLSADQSLYADDYRAYETTFSLLTQVMGRAGRRDAGGKALIQTFVPDNYVIELAAHQDYEGFYNTEIALRKMMKYPPYTDLCMFGFVGTEEAAVKQAAGRFLAMLRGAATGEYAELPMIVLDPSPAFVSRVARKYRYKLLIKTVNTARLRGLVAGLLTEFSRLPENKAVTVFADINPVSMM